MSAEFKSLYDLSGKTEKDYIRNMFGGYNEEYTMNTEEINNIMNEYNIDQGESMNEFEEKYKSYQENGQCNARNKILNLSFGNNQNGGGNSEIERIKSIVNMMGGYDTSDAEYIDLDNIDIENYNDDSDSEDNSDLDPIEDAEEIEEINESGYENDTFKLKYLKYKAKYMKLRADMEE